MHPSLITSSIFVMNCSCQAFQVDCRLCRKTKTKTLICLIFQYFSSIFQAHDKHLSWKELWIVNYRNTIHITYVRKNNQWIKYLKNIENRVSGSLLDRILISNFALWMIVSVVDFLFLHMFCHSRGQHRSGYCYGLTGLLGSWVHK